MFVVTNRILVATGHEADFDSDGNDAVQEKTVDGGDAASLHRPVRTRIGARVSRH